MDGRIAARARAFIAHEVLRLATLVATAAFLLDWATKSWAVHTLRDMSLPLGALLLGVEHNDAFAFSSGAGRFAPALVVGARLVALTAVVVLSRRVLMRSRRYAMGLALLLAGGFGNAADLLFRGGAVVDFIGAGPFTLEMAGERLHFSLVFNLADVAILLGILLMAPQLQAWALAGQRRVAAWEARWLPTLSRLTAPRHPRQQPAD